MYQFDIQQYKYIKMSSQIQEKKKKKQRQRQLKLKDWWQTQKTYLKKLKIIRDEIKAPLITNELIQKSEEAVIFPNLESMITLSEQMEIQIGNLIKTWNPASTLLAPTVEHLSIYLKIYKDFSNNFKKTDEKVQQLKKHPRFKDVVKVPYVQDYMITPIQRPLQYKLFVNDYIKLLPTEHPDKEKLQHALKKLLTIADQINDFVEKQLKASQMVQLDNRFGNLIESTRQYKSQFDAYHTDFRCRVYVFNNLLLVVKLWSEDKQQKFMYIYLCGASYLKRQPDNKNFKNRLYICGSYQSIHLTFDDSEKATKANDQIQELIDELYRKQQKRAMVLTEWKKKRQTLVMNRTSINNQYKYRQQRQYRMKLRVFVHGVEKRLYNKEWQAVFVVKVQLGQPQEIEYYMFYEMQQLREIQRYIKQVYPTIPNIVSLQTRLRGMGYDDSRTDFTKYFQYKAILLQDFLNFCLRDKEICKKPQFIVYKLKLHQNLWSYLNKSRHRCTCAICSQQQKLTWPQFKKLLTPQLYIANAFRHQKLLTEFVKLPQFNQMSMQQRLIWTNCKQKRVEYSFQLKQKFGKAMAFSIWTKLADQDEQIPIRNATINSTCRQIVKEACQTLSIYESQDFYLVYENSKNQVYLDDDEYIYNITKQIEEVEKSSIDKIQTLYNRTSFFFKYTESLKDCQIETSSKNKPKIYLRKSIILSKQLEIQSCERQPARFRAVLGELLRKFQQQYLTLTDQQIQAFCGLFYGAKEIKNGKLTNTMDIDEYQIRKYLPQQKQNIVSTNFLQKVKKGLLQKIKPTLNIYELQKNLLIQFGEKAGWISQFFKACTLNLQILGGIKQKSVLIGVNYMKIFVTKKQSPTNFLQFPILEFNYKISGDLLYIIVKQKQYKFVSQNWIFFDTLIQKYKILKSIQSASKNN